MQPAYIVSAYEKPERLARLVSELTDAPIAVHIDRKAGCFDEMRRCLSAFPNVTLLPRHVCHWGGFGHVAASIEGLRWFANTSADYAILLTGSCFPVRSQTEIRQELDHLAGRSLMEHAPFPKPEWEGGDRGGFNRIERFFIRVPGRKAPFGIPGLKRRFPFNLRPHGGSSYWCLSRACVEQALTMIDSDRHLVRFFRTTFTPDESFFQTLLLSSPLAATIDSKTIHYTDWSDGGGSPATITERHFPAIRASDAWFVRKVADVAGMDRIAAAFLIRPVSDIRVEAAQQLRPAI